MPLTNRERARIEKWRKLHLGRELVMVFFNAMGSGARTTARKSIQLMTRAMTEGPAAVDVLAGVECQRLPQGVRAKTWHTVHSPEADKAGLFFALRKSRGRILHWEYRVGTPHILGRVVARQMLARYVLLVLFLVDEGTPLERDYLVAVFHMPPKRNWLPFWVFMAANVKDLHMAGRRPDFYVADWNKLPRAVGPLLGLRVSMRDIVGWVSRWRIPVAGKGFPIGADHVAYVLAAWPTSAFRRAVR